MSSNLNQEEVKLKVSSKKHLWDAVKRNQKFIPDFKCKCITIDYLEGVRDGTYWAPNYDMVKMRPCTNPPKKQVIFNEIISICKMQEQVVDIGIKDEHGATTEYFLTLLSTIMPDHVIFSKGYMPSAEHSRYTRQSKKREICLDNSDGFFDGLPLHLRESKAFAGHKPRVPMKKRIVIADSDSDFVDVDDDMEEEKVPEEDVKIKKKTKTKAKAKIDE